MYETYQIRILYYYGMVTPQIIFFFKWYGYSNEELQSDWLNDKEIH